MKNAASHVQASTFVQKLFILAPVLPGETYQSYKQQADQKLARLLEECIPTFGVYVAVGGEAGKGDLHSYTRCTWLITHSIEVFLA